MDAAAASPPYPLGLHRSSSSAMASTGAEDPQQHQQQQQQQQHWRDFDNSVNAVSFGFVATAILIFMFLVMAIFEKFLRNSSPEFSNLAVDSGTVDDGRGRFGRRRDIEAQMGFNGKLNCPSPKMTVYTNGVSVLMPGNDVPTFIAHRAPVPCPPERIPWPPHQHLLLTPRFISDPS